MPVIIWFDDGLENTYSVSLPIMEEHGFKGVDSVITGYVGEVWHDEGARPDRRDKKMMTVDQLGELQSSGWDIVSHGVTHARFNLLSRSQAARELGASHVWIRRNLKTPPRVFVYPYGQVAYSNLTLATYYAYRTVDYGTWDSRDRVIPVTLSGGSSLEELRYALALAREPQTYAVMMLHSVLEGGEPWEPTPAEFRSALGAVKEMGVRVVTVKDSFSLPERLFPQPGLRSPAVEPGYTPQAYG